MKHPPSFSGDCLASCIKNNLPTDITAWVILIIAMAATIQLYAKKTQAGQRKADRRGAAGLTPQTVPTTKNII